MHLEAGKTYNLTISHAVDFGAYLETGDMEVLLPKKFLPANAAVGDSVTVFIYHDNENRLIATTEKPLAQLNEVAYLTVKSVADFGAFLDWGLSGKDLFLPLSQQAGEIAAGSQCLVYLFTDHLTGRCTASEKLHRFISNDIIEVNEDDIVDLMVWQITDIGYKVVINNRNIGVIHYSTIFRQLSVGDKLSGTVKHIYEGKIDVIPGRAGYNKVEEEKNKVLQALHENKGFLPLNDKSNPEDIYAAFGFSKKTFKMIVGGLYKEGRIRLLEDGILLV